ncbi:uncharacterized protein LOC123870828 [Maniola jurtina]|uniref:uncharacterized protein LOC123870828 n=1 Tax=Maniola jurtina TaxID=191418 RepID=UPI001E68EB7B|nr:uncharacterized protein LOC123870828 [Maniola jurtina]
MIANVTVYGSLGIMTLHFVLVTLHINSSFEVINKCLADILSEISRETSNHNPNRNEISLSYIPITSINKAIDLLGNMERDIKMTPRMKLARQISALSNGFVRTCEVMRDLNDTENIFLLVHVVVITMYLVITLNNLIQAACCITDLKYVLIATECVWFACHTLRIVLIVQPCHRIQEELSQTKMLVARIMCEVIHEADPLFDEMDNFFKLLHLNDVSISVMGIFSLGRSTISTIIGGATTLYVVLLEL